MDELDKVKNHLRAIISSNKLKHKAELRKIVNTYVKETEDEMNKWLENNYKGITLDVNVEYGPELNWHVQWDFAVSEPLQPVKNNKLSSFMSKMKFWK